MEDNLEFEPPVDIKRDLETYHNNPAVSQTQLKNLLRGPMFFKEKEENLFYTENKSFIIGSAVDILVTMGQGQFDKMFYVSKLEDKPSDTLMSILQEIHSLSNEYSNRDSLDNILESLILEVAERHNYHKNYKPETKIKTIVEKGEDYWKELIDSEGKIILSESENAIIQNILDSLRTNNTTVIDKLFGEREGIQKFNQLQVFFEEEDVSCKAMMDLVILDSINETVEVIDIKTTSSLTTEFVKNIKRFRYDIQASFYLRAIKKWLEDLQLADYTIKPFAFIVESTEYIGNPLYFTIDESVIEVGKNGLENIKGYKQLLSDYKYYVKNGFSNKDRTSIENEGVYKLSVGDIYKFQNQFSKSLSSEFKELEKEFNNYESDKRDDL